MLKRLGTVLAFAATFVLAAYDVMLIPTLMVNIEDQIKFGSPGHGVYVHTVKQVEPGQPFHLKPALRLDDPAAHPLKIYGSLIRRAPDGSVAGIFDKRLLFDIPAGAKGVFFSNISLKAYFAADDACGGYEWILRCSGDGSEKRASAAVKLVESISDRSPVDEKQFDELFNNYYRLPAPERLLAAMDYFFTSGEAALRQKKRNFDPRHILYGFVQALKLNPQFHDDLAQATLDAPEKYHLHYALIFAGLGKEAVMAQKELISPQVQVQIGQFLGRDPLAFTAVKAASHLDMLWMEFFVTGKFEPVRRIASELHKRNGMSLQQAQAKIKAGGQLSEGEKKDLSGHLIQFAADWSLTSNIRQGHSLLGAYLQSIVRKKLIEDNGYIGGRIAAILIKAKSSPRSKR